MNVKTNTLKSSFLTQYEKFRDNIPAQLIVTSILLIILSSVAWYRFIYLSTQNVFEGMLQGSLQVSGYTRTATTKEDGFSQKEITQLQFGSDNFIRRLTEVTQTANNQQNVIRREALGTPTADFERILSADTPSDPSIAAQYESVKGKWTKAEGPDGGVSNQYFLESLFGIVPMASLTPTQQEQLLGYMKQQNIYSIDSESPIKKDLVDGEQAYVYMVNVKPEAYITYLQLLGKALGLGDIPGLDPAAYQDAPDIQVELAINPASRQLLRVTYPNNAVRSEQYSSYGVQTEFELPKDAVPLNQLQGAAQ